MEGFRVQVSSFVWRFFLGNNLVKRGYKAEGRGVCEGIPPIHSHTEKSFAFNRAFFRTWRSRRLRPPLHFLQRTENLLFIYLLKHLHNVL